MDTIERSRELPVGPWLVWSNEHHAFWRSNRCGYTGDIEQAGRYAKAEAEAICRSACPRANSTIYEGSPPEICMPAPEALQSQESRIQELVGALEHAGPFIEKLTNDIAARVYRSEELGDVDAWAGVEDGKYDGDWASMCAIIEDARKAHTAAEGGGEP